MGSMNLQTVASDATGTKSSVDARTWSMPVACSPPENNDQATVPRNIPGGWVTVVARTD